MKSNKGITITSLIIYIIVFTIVIATVSTISGYFIKNTDDIIISTNSSAQHTKFTTYLSDDINSINFSKLEVKQNSININFLDGSSHYYIYNDQKIYYMSKKESIIDKTVVLCENVTNNNFEYNEDTKKLNISLVIDGIVYQNSYTI